MNSFVVKLLVLLMGVTAVAAHMPSIYIPTEFIVGFLGYILLTCVALILALISCCVPHRPKYGPEQQPFIAAETPTPSNDITVSKENTGYVLSEVKSDEILAWAHEPVIINRKAAYAFSAAFLCGVIYLVLFFFALFFGSGYLVLVILVCGPVSLIMAMSVGIYFWSRPSVSLYGVTNKRIFLLTISPKFCAGRGAYAQSIGFDDLQQASSGSEEDGSGNLSFSVNSLSYSTPAPKTQNVKPFVFENLPNAVAVKDLIESHKRVAQNV